MQISTTHTDQQHPIQTNNIPHRPTTSHTDQQHPTQTNNIPYRPTTSHTEFSVEGDKYNGIISDNNKSMFDLHVLWEIILYNIDFEGCMAYIGIVILDNGKTAFSMVFTARVRQFAKVLLVISSFLPVIRGTITTAFQLENIIRGPVPITVHLCNNSF